ncbi:hypothetical protein L1887_07010 [Cichorium endivia]|nr:hypothetical protein L1887_07010 [Cichorium endivia]
MVLARCTFMWNFPSMDLIYKGIDGILKHFEKIDPLGHDWIIVSSGYSDCVSGRIGFGYFRLYTYELTAKWILLTAWLVFFWTVWIGSSRICILNNSLFLDMSVSPDYYIQIFIILRHGHFKDGASFLNVNWNFPLLYSLWKYSHGTYGVLKPCNEKNTEEVRMEWRFHPVVCLCLTSEMMMFNVIDPHFLRQKTTWLCNNSNIFSIFAFLTFYCNYRSLTGVCLVMRKIAYSVQGSKGSTWIYFNHKCIWRICGPFNAIKWIRLGVKFINWWFTFGLKTLWRMVCGQYLEACTFKSDYWASVRFGLLGYFLGLQTAGLLVHGRFLQLFET